MGEQIGHECGVAALYRLDAPVSVGGRADDLAADGNIAPLLPTMLMDLQNRGQLAAGISTYNVARSQLLDTFKDIGSVGEVFRMTHAEKCRSILDEYAGSAGIGHTRYATCGADDTRYAQPFERHHGRLWKWFSFAFNGTLANYPDLRQRLLSKHFYHCSLDTDTEILMHLLSYRLRGDSRPDLQSVMDSMAEDLDGAYTIAYLDALGRMFVSRDPLGMRPLCWSAQGKLFAAASESVALRNLGFTDIRHVAPGQMVIVEDGEIRTERFAPQQKTARCFFEWIYFANVAGSIDGSPVYRCRNRTGEALADAEDLAPGDDCVIVPVPDTAKAAAAAYAFRMGLPCLEGVMRNRYVGRTFIQPETTRGRSVWSKYTPLPSVLDGKRVLLVEDSIVRATTLRSLVTQLREDGGAAEIHVRVACPPIVAPCFYGIDMSSLSELFAPRFTGDGCAGTVPEPVLREMAAELGIDSLRYLDVASLGPCIGCANDTLCLGCVTGRYPTPWGERLMETARRNRDAGVAGRVFAPDGGASPGQTPAAPPADTGDGTTGSDTEQS